jgi:two-component system, cell cycle response regulator DivK
MTRFVYVEDDVMSQEIFKILMTRVLGYKEKDMTILPDSTDFEARLRKLRTCPKIIFLDIHMLPYDGFEVLKIIRDSPTHARASVIAMTAGVMATDIVELKKAGFDGMIGKPIRKKVFPDLLRRILEGESVWFAT